MLGLALFAKVWYSTAMTNIEIPADRIAGAVYGLAYGDAIGYPTEFHSYKTLTDRGVYVPDLLKVSDDTQMSIAVLTSLRMWDQTSLAMLRMELAVDFGAWYHDKDNNRAPGATCMSALRTLEVMGIGEWVNATSPDSAGCGSVMRAPWIGLVGFLSDEQVEQAAMLQAVLTHGPSENAYCAAALAALTRALALDEVKLGGCSEWLYKWADERSYLYDEQALGLVNEVVRGWGDRSGLIGQTRRTYVAEGFQHVKWVAAHVASLSGALSEGFWDIDPCSIAGEGWRARECMAVAVGIVDAMGSDIIEGDGLIRAAYTNGDSDSIGAITGALIGAARGNVWPEAWFAQLEPRYQGELQGTVNFLVNPA